MGSEMCIRDRTMRPIIPPSDGGVEFPPGGILDPYGVPTGQISATVCYPYSRLRTRRPLSSRGDPLTLEFPGFLAGDGARTCHMDRALEGVKGRSPGSMFCIYAKNLAFAF